MVCKSEFQTLKKVAMKMPLFKV